MVQITNGVNTFTVTSGAFKTTFKKQGYRLVNEKPVKVEKEKKVEEKVEPEKVAEEVVESPVETEEPEVDEFAALLEKPISQWNKNEVKKFAAAKDINLQGTKNVNEAKALIKEFLEEEAAE